MAPRLRFAAREEGGLLSKRTLGILAGMVGSAVGAWWWTRQRSTAAHSAQHRRTAAREHGTVIFHNTPTPVEGDVL
jgi:hypothetical protein